MIHSYCVLIAFVLSLAGKRDSADSTSLGHEDSGDEIE